MKVQFNLTDDALDELVVQILKDQLDTVRSNNCTDPEDIEYDKQMEVHLIEVLKYNLPRDEWDEI